MRFEKGSKVEVLSKKEVPSGSWRCGEIIFGNGRNYSVMYDCSSGMTGEVVVERVSRNAIRPRPPVVSVERWATSDMVEVFNDFSWKTATVLKIMGGDYYFVKLFGSSKTFSIHKSNIRVQQLWKDDQWVVISKGSGSYGDVTLDSHQRSFQVLQVNMKRKVQPGGDRLAVQNNIGLQESPVVSSRTLKRSFPYCSSLVEACTAGIQKMRAIGKDVRHEQEVQGPLLEKVDAVAYPRKSMGEKYMHASFNNRTTGYYEMDKGKPNIVLECSLAGSSEQNDFDTDACSIGSCSVSSNRTNMLPSRIISGHSQDSDTLISDAESFYDWEYEEEKCPLLLEKDLNARIHRLEMHAYRSTLEAFYASGPLSWEREALLTNLRLSLHISNDEHLMELKTLVSSQKSLRIG